MTARKKTLTYWTIKTKNNHISALFGRGAFNSHKTAKVMKDRILATLAKIESERNVKILYACESGSRAWGFPSPDSDWDVRFIYAHPAPWYLSYNVESRRDVIELPIVDEIDCNGWDIRKACYLFARTNGALLEWLGSPIRYIDTVGLPEMFGDLAELTTNKTALCYHYRHMAKGNAREYINGVSVRLKKYLYVIRPLLAIRYIIQFNKVPPVRFSELVAAVCPDYIVQDLQRLLDIKRDTPELGMGDAIPSLNAFIESELAEADGKYSGQGRPIFQGDVDDRLNRIFKRCIAGTAPMYDEYYLI